LRSAGSAIRAACEISVLGLAALAGPLRAQVVCETTSPYHHILVVDEKGLRTLYFDSAMESRVSLRDPLRGHFEYTEYFHMPWLWNERITNALMIGLGGGSFPRACQRFHPGLTSEVVELDPKVVRVAKDFFFVNESPTLKIVVADGRVHLRRSRQKYDLIVMDAYTGTRYGSFLPYSLATKEFFALASDHLTTNGVLAYNVIGTIESGRKPNLVGALCETLNVVFPQVYLFPASSSGNVVLIATRSAAPATLATLNAKADDLLQRKVVTVPEFKSRLQAFRSGPRPGATPSLILTDDFAPLDGMLRAEP
jgi:spermidine synthase